MRHEAVQTGLKAHLNRRFAVAAMLLLSAVVAVTVTLIVVTALDRVASYANHLDEERSRETIRGAIQTFRYQLDATLNDYAAWDDAADNVYDPSPSDWSDRNFGDMTYDSDLFDVAILLDRAGRSLMAYSDGSPIAGGLGGYLRQDIQAMLKEVQSREAGGTPQVSGFVRTDKGIGAAGVALIRKKSGEIEVPPERRAYLVFIRHLTPGTVDRHAAAYVLPGLSLVPASTRSTHRVAIESPSGVPLAALAWSPRAPGDMSRQQVEALVTTALVIVGLFCLTLLLTGWMVVRRLRADEQAAVRLSLTDQLSGVANREGLFRMLETRVAEAQVTGDDVVLIYLDLDGFKEINDAYGHATGDSLIRAVAAGLTVLAGDPSALARIGGDEFAIVLKGEDAQARAEVLSEAILSFFNEPLLLGDRVVVVGCSIGLCVSSGGHVDADELIRRADMAMYSSKDGGRGRWTFYDAGMDDAREMRNQLELDLRAAIQDGEISVVYQPIVDAHSFDLVGVEALARWTRRGHGPVSPDVFIPIAEASGLIDRLGLCVLDMALSQLKRWPGIKLSVNISPGQFRDPAFVCRVEDLFEQANVDPQRVVLEMTETYFIQNAERARMALDRLRRIGVRIALDDFGVGFSSVGYLRQFGFDRMKIDRSLIQSLGDGHRAVEMLQATVALARSLNIPVTAEGVETEQQAVILRLAGCDQLQGYLFGRPSTVEDIDAYRARSMTPRARAADIAFAAHRGERH
ncbi:EAL domain-containing protein [Rhizobium sp. AAP43]|uniref:bifunctional diguanylate cyclase/phosphodiesterase n=1 Tax=Rhizobium sp. AAP43 TaxID=1523420 RepID=UPI0006B8DFFD|nr:EAL domain-containing protein [Rhizobium sp. AAP43]KPF46246.1 diguanylate cyclase [Rhizobium sp. AAP43]